jgi:hypothetical protein
MREFQELPGKDIQHDEFLLFGITDKQFFELLALQNQQLHVPIKPSSAYTV